MNPDEQTKEYFSVIEKNTNTCYAVAKKVKAKGIDIEDEINIPIAKDLAARVEGLISSFYPKIKNCGIQNGIRSLEKKYGKNSERVALEAGRDIALGKYAKFDSKQESLEMGLRIAIGYLTQGVVTAPLEGISDVLLKKNSDGTEYAAVYYAGPIRSAGGTASALSVVACDFIRKALNIDDYKPEEREIKRYETEIEDYSTRIVEKQYHPTAEEIKMMIENIPVEVTGDPTERLDVSNYKDLPRVETNKIRGGMCLVFLDGIPLKAEKVLKRIKKYPKDYGLNNWLWLDKFIKLKHRLHSIKKKNAGDEKYTPNTKYMSKIIAGRPVFSFPNTKGGFNLRYGRSRTGGIASTSVHPGAMYLTEFIAIGTQLAEELPGKATVGTVCDSINAPIVLLEDKSVVLIDTKEKAKKYRPFIDKILSLGDLLIPYGEFINNGHILLPSSYVEEWWAREVEEAMDKTKGKENHDIEEYLESPYKKPDFLTALLISKKLNVPIHPQYLFFWHDISKDAMCKLIDGVQKSIENQNSAGEVVFDLIAAEQTGAKKVLEDLCILHNVLNGKIIIEKNRAYALLYCLGLVEGEKEFGNNFLEKIKAADTQKIIGKIEKAKDTMESVNLLANIKIPKKTPHRVGMKMGRPEKAERRIMKGSPQLLFPCGHEGGKTRNIMETAEKKSITAMVSNYICPMCGNQTPFPYCMECKKRTILTELEKKNFKGDSTGMKSKYCSMTLDVKKLLQNAMKNIDEEAKPKLFKAVRGVMGIDRNVEFMEKGVLRVKYDLYVNKDGTVRYDSINVPLTHFKPKEIDVSIEKLKELGYTKDMDGKALENRNQVLEMNTQDIIISDNSIFSGANYLINICKFVDDLLVKFYHEKPFYNVKTKEDLLGHLVIGLAPHTSAGVMGRIIGFTPARVGYAHPFWHAAKRRNCDGDEDSIMMLMDALLNFSKTFLPDTRGGRSMDAPLVLTSIMNPEEVDDESWNVDIDTKYPLSFYRETEKYKFPWELSEAPRVVEDVINSPEAFHIKYTHETSDINDGMIITRYVSLQSMEDKVHTQLDIGKKLIAVDENHVADNLLQKHFLKDIKGNMRTFSKQAVRCIECNEKYRRIPLLGVCIKCKGKLVFSVSEGFIRKYMEPSKQIIEEYKISPYLCQQFAILEKQVDDLFGKKDRQMKLFRFE
ncbi:MAG: DNA polymerase II large subunit [Candidatus Nanohalarchaeota archaeon]|nr:MAG: DNA polymerase II large subunit [Candidatus Nanohaloarchaeota archaeon]